MKIKTGVMKAVESMLMEKKNVSLPEMAKIFYPNDVDQIARQDSMPEAGTQPSKEQRVNSCVINSVIALPIGAQPKNKTRNRLRG